MARQDIPAIQAAEHAKATGVNLVIAGRHETRLAAISAELDVGYRLLSAPFPSRADIPQSSYIIEDPTPGAPVGLGQGVEQHLLVCSR
jgi:hypothetical protein